MTFPVWLKYFAKGILIIAFGYFFWLMLLLTLDYIPIQPDVSFLMIKQTEVVSRPEYLYFFYTHVYTSIFVLLSGFVALFFQPYKVLHRICGRLYVILILLFSAPSGFYMGIFANGGIFSKISFVILSIFWWLTTYMAFRKIKSRDIYNHKKWMWRSYVLTLSAITLRIWKVILVYLFHPNPMDVYQIIAWLGWIPNIILVEILLNKKK